MASLILGASMLTYNKIKEARAKKREKKLWREASYKDLERETAERLAAREGKDDAIRESEGERAAVGVEGQRGRNNPFFANGEKNARARSSSEGRREAEEVEEGIERPMAKDRERQKVKDLGPIGQSPQWWEEKRRMQR